MVGRQLACAVVFGALSSGGSAHALGPNGSEIDTSDYTIDLHQGPITDSSRVIGLAGSISPLVEGVGGYALNPASAAVRVPWSRSWFDWELDLSFTSSSITNSDFDNNGDGSFASDGAEFVSAGVGLQFGAWGIGLRVNSGDYRLQTPDPSFPENSIDLEVSTVRANLVTGYSFWRGALVLGYGISVSSVELGLPGTDGGDVLASVQGIAMQFGGVWAPPALPLRVGLGVSVPVSDDESTLPDGVTPDMDGNYVTQGYYLPREVRMPVELHVAVAAQWFRPLNVPWPREDEPPKAQPLAAGAASGSAGAGSRPGRLLVAAALQVTGPVENGVGIESFLSQVVERSGRHTSYSPRIGIEGEPVPNWLILRAGSYLEPTRFDTSSARLHATSGLDVHLPIAWSVFGLFDDQTTFRVGGAVDWAERYFAWTLSFGIWR